jgi:hypothetical protein
VQRFIIERTTGLGIRYPMVYGGEPAPEHQLLGTRVPDYVLKTATGVTSVAAILRDGRGLLLDLSAGGTPLDDLSGWSDRLNVVAAQPLPGSDCRAVLIRPDGYVAYVDADGTGGEGLRAALTTWFGQPQPSSAVPPKEVAAL